MNIKNTSNTRYFNALSRIFTPFVLDSIAEKGYSPYLNEVCVHCGLISQLDKNQTFASFFDLVYGILLKNYRNEYIYKNVIAKNILLGKHSLATSRMLTELRVGKCKADVVIINGTSTVYEIKSEYDSFNRLEKQITSYLDMFDRINVITTEVQSEKLKTVLPESCGIMILTERNSISVVRDAQSNKVNIRLPVLFDSLRKQEYTQIVREYYGAVPDVPNTQLFGKCKELYCSMLKDAAYDMTMNILKQRTSAALLQNYIKNAPVSLYGYILNSSNTINNMTRFMNTLSKNINMALNPAQA